MSLVQRAYILGNKITLNGGIALLNEAVDTRGHDKWGLEDM